MIKLFVTDLDGCISTPFQTPNWDAINKIRELNILSRTDESIPPITICTGRPYPYAEAVAQWLDVKLPFIFESAGLFHWEGNRIETALDTKDSEPNQIREIKNWLKSDVLPRYPEAVLEFTKMMDAGIICTDEVIVNEIHDLIKEKINQSFPTFEVHATDVSVNTLMPGNDKLQGLKLLSKSLKIGLDEMAYIGDSSGDVPAMKNVHFAFAPSNARQIAKDHATELTQSTTEAVLEAYSRVIKYNRNLLSD
ncbi:MAG: HAD family hydrolase [Balneolaceae bacterium]